jgi:hypothetical protein
LNALKLCDDIPSLVQKYAESLDAACRVLRRIAIVASDRFDWLFSLQWGVVEA